MMKNTGVFAGIAAGGRGVAVAMAALGLIIPACSTLGSYKPLRAVNARDAGSVHVHVQAVAPWSHYVDALEPSFYLSADDALNLVVPDTRSTAESSTRASGVSAGVTEKPGVTGLPPRDTIDEPESSFFVADEPSLPDPMLMYTAATALYQEVQLLNRTLRDAAIPDGYRPYMVRLQVSLEPRRRHQPYDVYTTLSFFSPSARAATSGDPTAISQSLAPPRAQLRALGGGGDVGRGPKVISLLVTDNLEGSRAMRSSESSTKLAFSLLALPGSFAADLGAELFQSEMKAQIQGRDLNALLTVSRLSDNSLRVRIGAMQETTAEFAMVNRNHNVTLLLMVPDEAPGSIDLVSQTTLIDTGTGEELPYSDEEEIVDMMIDVLGRFPYPGLGLDTIEELQGLTQQNDQVGFFELLREATDGATVGDPCEHALWMELTSLMLGSQYTASRFELPGHGEWELPITFGEQTALVVDDGFSATAVLRGATFADSVELEAMLRLSTMGREVALLASSIEVYAETKEVRINFPSLSELGLVEAPDLGPELTMTLMWDDETMEFDAFYVVPTIRQSGTPIGSDGGE